MEAILHIPKLDLSFVSTEKSFPILKNFRLSLHRGRCMGLVGESGSGKTLSALSILQLLPQNAYVGRDSQIIFQDRNLLDVSEKNMRRIRGKSIGMIFQDAMSAFNPVLTIGQQLSETIRLHLSFNRRDAKCRSLELLKEVDIQDTLRCYQSYPHELSGGMRQRAMIAMAICAEPEIIIADEPTTSVDVDIQKHIIDLLLRIKVEKNTALLFIGHDLAVVRAIADDITVLKKGDIVEQSDAASFFEHPHHPYSQQLFDAILPTTPRHIHGSASVAMGNRYVDGSAHDGEHEECQIILSVENLSVYFPKNKLKAVDNVSFTVEKGKTVALIGQSGSGKTTTAKAILQLIKNNGGNIIFEGLNLAKLSGKQLRSLRADMQIIFQDPYAALNPRMMIFDSLCEGLLIQKRVRNKSEAASIVDALLKEVDLPDDCKWRYPHEFSGGQRQRICIARALTLSPKLLILDEPTSALDVSTQKQILELLDRLQREKQLSYLLITHNASVVAYLAHKIVKMRDGKIENPTEAHT